jgi:ribonuclease Z
MQSSPIRPKLINRTVYTIYISQDEPLCQVRACPIIMPSYHAQRDLPVLPLNAGQIITAIAAHKRRVLLIGPMGVGKSTLARQLASTLAQQHQACWCLNADPGTPAFGNPGAVALARWERDNWQVSAQAALCTLDAGRFRLPLISALRSLLPQLPNALVLIDAPGVVRGVAGRELLDALVDAMEVDAVLALTASDRPPPMLDELRTLPIDVHVIHTLTETARPGKRSRAQQRTQQWDSFLADATTQDFDLTQFNIVGTPPPLDEAHAWSGRQVALLHAHQTLAMGEVLQLKDNRISVRVAGDIQQADTLLIRDAVRNDLGLIETAAPFAVKRYDYLPPADVLSGIEISSGPRIVGRVGAVDMALLNGVFGDPLLHLRLRHLRRSLFFDLGDASRLPARTAHQVTDIFISHAHMDHISGFLWLLRSRLGDYPTCRLYGPPGLAQHIYGFLQGILWDRIADRGPHFEVLELHGGHLKHFQLQAGSDTQVVLGESIVSDDILLKEAGFCVKGITLDHHGTQVMAYALQPDIQVNIRKDRLRARKLSPGPWLNVLKQHILMNNDTGLVQLPDNTAASAGDLAQDLAIITPGKKLAYATDLADTADNRQRLTTLAHHAHTFFCEAPFLEAEVAHATRNGHLTTRACGEIAFAANVSHLVPFHFSRRYSDDPQPLYEEIERYCPRVLTPQSRSLFTATTTSTPEVALEFTE